MLFALVLVFVVTNATFPHHVDHAIVFSKIPPLSERSQTGFIEISDSSRTFYWLFESDEIPKSKPLIVWLQGQIGLTSTFGVLNEFTPDWLNHFNIVFVDAPVGTGFSQTVSSSEIAYSSEVIATQVFHFLNLFYERHGQQVGRDVILAGEDYAGHTIPVIANLILQHRGFLGLEFNLVGTSVGNGHTHAPIQVITKAESATIFGLIDGECIPEARKHAWEASLLSVAGKTLESLEQRNLLEQTILNCSSSIDMSNVAKKLSENDGVETLSNWMNNKEVQIALGLGNQSNLNYVPKNMTVLEHLKPDIMRVIWDSIPPVLNAGIRMLWYQGQLDWVDGVYSNEAWLNALHWKGDLEYAKARREEISGGYKKEHGPLTEAVFLNTGHLAIRDRPKEVLELFKSTFIPMILPRDDVVIA